jgi:hypothetical protein
VLKFVENANFPSGGSCLHDIAITVRKIAQLVRKSTQAFTASSASPKRQIRLANHDSNPSYKYD